MDKTRTAKRSKSLEVEPLDGGLLAFRLRLDDTSQSPEGPELIHSLGLDGVLSLPELEIKSITATAYKHPYPECAASIAPVQQLVGARIGPGFRDRVLTAMGRTRGCTHFLTLALDLAAAHTLSVFLRMRSQVPFEARDGITDAWMRKGLEIEPRLENACIALRSESGVIRRAKAAKPSDADDQR
jgi:hypothetical protein